MCFLILDLFFEEITEIFERSQSTFYCNTNWEIKTLNTECRNCRLLQNFCIQCFLYGNLIQENHQIYKNLTQMDPVIAAIQKH